MIYTVKAPKRIVGERKREREEWQNIQGQDF